MWRVPARRQGATTVLLCLGLLAPLPAFGQAQNTALVRGRVSGPGGDDGPAGGLAGVTVTARSTALIRPVTTITGTSGAYVLPLLPPGDYVVAFDRDDLYPVRFTTSLTAGQQRAHDVTMRPVVDAREAITVNIDMSTIERRALTTTIWQTIETSRPVLGGILATAQYAATPVATQPGRAQVQIGGARIAAVPAELLPPLRDTVSSTTLAGGVLPVSSGWLDAGAIELVTRTGSERWSGSARFTAGGASLDADDPTIARGTDGVSTVGEYAGGGPLSPGRAWLFASSMHASETIAQSAGNTTAIAESERSRHYFQARGTVTVTGRDRLVGQWLSIGAERDDRFGTTSFSSADRSSDAGTVFYDAWLGNGAAVSGRLQHEGGGDDWSDEWTWRVMATTLVDRGPGPQVLHAGYEGRTAPDARTSDQAIFASDSLQAPGNVTVDLGLRWDRLHTGAGGATPGRSDHALSPRVFASWTPGPFSRWLVRGGLARNVGIDDNRRPLATTLWTIGFDRRIGRRVHVEADAFQRRSAGLSAADDIPERRHHGLTLRSEYEIGIVASVGGSYAWSRLERSSQRVRFWGRVDPMIDDDLGFLTVEVLHSADAGRLLDTAAVSEDDDETLYRTDFGVLYWRRLPGTIYGRLFAHVHLLNLFGDVRVADLDGWGLPASGGTALTMPRTFRLSLGVRFR